MPQPWQSRRERHRDPALWKSRRVRKRYLKRKKKLQQKPFTQQIHWEEAQLHNWEAQLERREEEKARNNYGFFPDLSSSTRQNSIRVLGDMPTSAYFEKPHHLEFHDFTPGRQLPPAAKLILGLSYKFVPRPKATTTRKKQWRPSRD